MIEDDENKRRQVSELIRQEFRDVELGEARSLRSGLRAIKDERWELVILDMSIPAFDITVDEPGGTPQALGGRELLAHMRRLRVRTPVVVLTQFDEFGSGSSSMNLNELSELLAREHGHTYRGAIMYNVVVDEWRKLLTTAIHTVKTERR